MGVLLHRSNDLPSPVEYQNWVGIGGLRATPDGPAMDLSAALEDSFDSQAQHWLKIGYDLALDPSADLAHTPACVANASDFGAMLGWGALLKKWSDQTGTVLVVCDDPWLFRHFRRFPGVVAGTAPPLLPQVLRLAIRGYLARMRFTVRMVVRYLRQARPSPAPGGSWVLTYAHPSSNGAGQDAYFGDLMSKLPGLRRVLHVDGRAEVTERLISERTVALSSWGSIWSAFGLPFVRWRPSRRHRHGPQGWLVRRAAAMEGVGSGRCHPLAANLPAEVHGRPAAKRRGLALGKPRLGTRSGKSRPCSWSENCWLSAFCRRPADAELRASIQPGWGRRPAGHDAVHRNDDENATDAMGGSFGAYTGCRRPPLRRLGKSGI